MERIEALIHKLGLQLQAGEGADRLLVTASLLQAELQSAAGGGTFQSRGKVAVMMPGRVDGRQSTAHGGEGTANGRQTINHAAAPEPAAEKIVYELKEEPVVISEAHAPYVPPAIEALEQEMRYAVPSRPDTAKETPVAEAPAKVTPVAEAPPKAAIPSLFETESAAPTLEVHQRIASNTSSLNDILKPAQMELGHVLKESPVKDLRKAIGINDRFVFVQELFRGDEAMYERSIKTINSFGILAEAEYWINRELKVKLGWNDTAETVQHFYGLVRRRFSSM